MAQGHGLVRMYAVTGAGARISSLPRAQCTLHRLSIIRIRNFAAVVVAPQFTIITALSHSRPSIGLGTEVAGRAAAKLSTNDARLLSYGFEAPCRLPTATYARTTCWVPPSLRP